MSTTTFATVILVHVRLQMQDLRDLGYQFKRTSGPHGFSHVVKKRLADLTRQEKQTLLSIGEGHLRKLTSLKLRVQGSTAISKRLQCYECAKGLRRRRVGCVPSA